MGPTGSFATPASSKLPHHVGDDEQQACLAHERGLAIHVRSRDEGHQGRALLHQHGTASATPPRRRSCKVTHALPTCGWPRTRSLGMRVSAPRCCSRHGCRPPLIRTHGSCCCHRGEGKGKETFARAPGAHGPNRDHAAQRAFRACKPPQSNCCRERV